MIHTGEKLKSSLSEVQRGGASCAAQALGIFAGWMGISSTWLSEG